MSHFKNRQGMLSLSPNTLIAISEGTRLLEYRSKIHDKNYPNGILLKRLAFSLKNAINTFINATRFISVKACDIFSRHFYLFTQ